MPHNSKGHSEHASTVPLYSVKVLAYCQLAEWADLAVLNVLCYVLYNTFVEAGLLSWLLHEQ